MPVPSTRRISENVLIVSQSASPRSILIRLGRRSMWRLRERRKAEAMSSAIRVAVIALFAVVLPATSSLAQAPGRARVGFVKAGLMVGAGGGSGVLTYRSRDYPFRVSGLSLGVTAGSSVSWLEGWTSGIREVSDFTGAYSSVGAGGALV